MRYYKISNPGTVPVDALTLFGATTKDGKSTIGRFGSGFKYALALAMRLGLDISFTTGDGQPAWKLSTEARDIGSGNQALELVLKRGRVRLNMRAVTSLGKEDWTEAFQVLREIICNAQDAGNPSFAYVNRVESVPGEVAVFIAVTPQVLDCLNNLPKRIRFLAGSEYSTIAENSHGELLDAPEHIFCRGVFIKQAQDACWGYDFKQLKLTESRSVDSYFMDCAIRDLVKHLRIEEMATWLKRNQLNPSSYEGQIGKYHWYFNRDWIKPAWTLAFGEEAVCDCHNLMILDRIEEACRISGKRVISFPNSIGEALIESGVPSVSTAIGDVSKGIVWVGEELVDPKLRGLVEHWWPRILKAIGGSETVRYFNSPTTDLRGCVLEQQVGIRWDHEANEYKVLSCLVEEAIHHDSHASDLTRDFQNAACGVIANLIRILSR